MIELGPDFSISAEDPMQIKLIHEQIKNLLPIFEEQQNSQCFEEIQDLKQEFVSFDRFFMGKLENLSSEELVGYYRGLVVRAKKLYQKFVRAKDSILSEKKSNNKQKI